MLAWTAHELNLVWRRAIRRRTLRERWRALDPRLDVDPVELPDVIADRSPEGRELFAVVVGLAVDGDEPAALTVMVALLPRMVASESRHRHYEHDALASTLWEAIVTSTRLERRWLREDIERRAWRAMWRERGHRACFPVAAVDEPCSEAERLDWSRTSVGRGCSRLHGGEDVADAVVSAETITWMFSELSREQRLSDDGRQFLASVAAGTALPIDRRQPGGQAAKKRRERTFSRIRSSSAVTAALAG